MPEIQAQDDTSRGVGHALEMLKGLLFSFGFLVAALSMIFLDQDLSAFFAMKEHHDLYRIAREITDIALGEYWFGLAILVYLFARFWPMSGRFTLRHGVMTNLRRWSLHLFFGLLGSGVLLRIAKFLVGRQRPHKSEIFDPFVFAPFNNDWHMQSMPSGHSQVLFSVATTATMLWPRSGWVLFPLAAALAFTRVMTLQHFLSDVIVGAMFGYFGTLWVRGLLKKKIPLPTFFNDQETRRDGTDRGSLS